MVKLFDLWRNAYSNILSEPSDVSQVDWSTTWNWCSQTFPSCEHSKTFIATQINVKFTFLYSGKVVATLHQKEVNCKNKWWKSADIDTVP